MISNIVNFTTRLMIANGIFYRKFIFNIGLLGGTEDILLMYCRLFRTKLLDLLLGRNQIPVQQAVQ